MTWTDFMAALTSLEQRYTHACDRFSDAERNDELPLWMSADAVRAAKALLLAKRDVVADLRTELIRVSVVVDPRRVLP